MSAPYSNLESKLEAAAKAVHDAAGTGYASRTGLDSGTKSLPAVLFRAEKQNESPLNSGNYHITLTITVMDNADTVTLDNHRNGAGQVFDVFLDEDIAATLSAVNSSVAPAVNGFTILNVFGRDGAATRAEDRQWISEISLKLYGCPADIG